MYTVNETFFKRNGLDLKNKWTLTQSVAHLIALSFW
jgi:hypothetical protein